MSRRARRGPRPALPSAAVVALGGLLLAGASGDVGLSLRSAYQGEVDEEQTAHRAGLGLALELGLASRARLQLRSRYTQLLWREAANPRVALPPAAAGGLDLGLAAAVLVDELPGVDPLVLVELVGGYHPLASATWVQQLHAGVAVGAGVDVRLGSGWFASLAARYTQRGALERWLGAQSATSGLELELGLGYRWEPGRAAEPARP